MSATEHERAFAPLGFDFSAAMSSLCADVADRLDAFSHIRMDRIVVTFAQTRRNVPHGLQAKLTPMRFENGSLTTRRRGRTWTAQRLYRNEREMLYILTFYLPRFLNHSFREKMITVFHELYHIGPRFDGDIRRFGGHYCVHTRSQKGYDRVMEQLVDEYLALNPPPEHFAFLRSDYSTLEERHGGVMGLRVPVPKLIPVDDSRSA
ncbi:MAG: putative metallopeptidase [Planctomycetaceae bacterium]